LSDATKSKLSISEIVLKGSIISIIMTFPPFQLFY